MIILWFNIECPVQRILFHSQLQDHQGSPRDNRRLTVQISNPMKVRYPNPIRSNDIERSIEWDL